MAARAEQTNTVSPDAEQVLLAMGSVREQTLALVAHLSDEQLEAVLSPIMSPLVWDLGHVAAYEDLWLGQRHGGLQLLRPELAGLYDAFETPRAVRGEIEALRAAEAREYMAQVRARTCAAIAARGVADGVLCELVLRHELQHSETMRQTLAIAGLLAASDLDRQAAPLAGSGAGEEWVRVPGGAFAIGSTDDGFAYDNERPRHTVDVRAFRIARHPVSNASWMRFSEGGGYERREWWSDEGWAWKEQEDITHHSSIAAGRPEAPACHVSWFEADAFARAHDARLPTEAEWEKAATWSQERRPAADGAAATPSLATREGAVEGALEAVGRLWEWTGSHFDGYPGFVPYPYREYSEVFFGERYRVLRGGSWATHPRVAGVRFRNWDLPQRRQIFAGLRLAKDA
jgi:gamma-glutamyl hercynylcysteine S-oxide synthase